MNRLLATAMDRYIRLIFALLLYSLPLSAQAGDPEPDRRVIVGAERMPLYLPQLAGKQVGLIVNPSARVGKTHLVDTLDRLGVCIARIFVPEHGLRGAEEAGQWINDANDPKTGTPIVSLYGRKKKPSPADLAGIDVMVFDIQDVGARFYTYISTLFLLLEACAEQDIAVIVLDRPNPNGHYVDGPVLDTRWQSFVGIAPLPIVHGCTVGELARLFVGEYWVSQPHGPLDLQVIPCDHYDHDTYYSLPINPSPNLTAMRAILLYPSLCLFEGTVASVGRGTPTPFQWVGHPLFPDTVVAFVPRSNGASKNPLYAEQVCRGIDLRDYPLDSLRTLDRLPLQWLLDFYNCYPYKDHFFLSNGFFDLLAGTPQLRRQIEEGCTETEIRASWEEDLRAFRHIRQKYLLYPQK